MRDFCGTERWSKEAYMRRYLTVFLVLVLVLAAAFPLAAHAQESLSEEQLTATMSTDDAALEKEAAEFGMPASETVRYVSRMKALNQDYQNGALTTTEYVGAKRRLIEELK